jgi:ribonuclease BN (tRNA processing enzyme)
MGTGKSTLAAGIAQARAGRVLGLSADPGSPAFGLPGAVSLGEWHQQGWRCIDMVPLCTLDAARFRLPLLQAVAQLAHRASEHMLIVDAPGVVRGVAAAEILHGLAELAGIDAVIVLNAEVLDHLSSDLDTLGCPVFRVPADPAARRPAPGDRKTRRTQRWNAHLADAPAHELPLEALKVVGTPPPFAVPVAWHGRQVALLRRSETVAMGEILTLGPDTITIRIPVEPASADTLMVRDAQRNAAGALVSAPAAARLPRRHGAVAEHRSSDAREAVNLWVEGVGVHVVNGVLGDPLVALKMANVHRTMLFDLGEAVRLPVKALHGVSDVFVSHGHFDHIGGFPSLLRARLSGDQPPCRLYGPPGIVNHVAGFVAGVRWDRIGDAGPVFLVAEVGDDRLHWSRIQPGHNTEDLGSEPLTAGVLLSNSEFQVRCATLDHGIPVLAFLLQLADGLHVREAQLTRRRLQPGPWLGQLKRQLSRGDLDSLVELPDGTRERAGDLGDAFMSLVPGTRIAYATDLADTPANRRTLCHLAWGADLLICESTFLAADIAQARATRHLTARACVEIATQAEVARLLPFHFSRRYSKRLAEVHGELLEASRGTALEGKLVGTP